MLLEAAHTSDPSFDPARSARQHRAAAPMSDQLPAIVQPGALSSPSDTYIVPALIADAGWRYVEFFTANIRNPHTRRAYARACARFSPGARIADLR